MTRPESQKSIANAARGRMLARSNPFDTVRPTYRPPAPPRPQIIARPIRPEFYDDTSDADPGL